MSGTQIGPRLLVATHNSGKLEEIAHLLSPFGVTCVGAAELGLEVPEETEDDFVGNARLKAQAASRGTGLPALADDSGLCVDALGGAPGIHTADWAETPGGRDFLMAMRRVHRELVSSGAPEPHRARFRCALVLAAPDGRWEAFEGDVAGRIVWPMRGEHGHGYDPIFQPDGHDVTFGEMDRWEKNHISHRAVAFRKLISRLDAR